MLQNLILEGLDRLGKSTLASEIEARLGCFTKLHFGKPPTLKYYEMAVGPTSAMEAYQRDSFEQMFTLLDSDARLLLDRAHLGESVYAKRYRGYDGDYVFELESVKHVNALSNTLLVLLVNFDTELERTLVDDGDSFDWSRRAEEQDDFNLAFNKSRFRNKLRLQVGSNGAFIDKHVLVNRIIEQYHGSKL